MLRYPPNTGIANGQTVVSEEADVETVQRPTALFCICAAQPSADDYIHTAIHTTASIQHTEDSVACLILTWCLAALCLSLSHTDSRPSLSSQCCSHHHHGWLHRSVARASADRYNTLVAAATQSLVPVSVAITRHTTESLPSFTSSIQTAVRSLRLPSLLLSPPTSRFLVTRLPWPPCCRAVHRCNSSSSRRFHAVDGYRPAARTLYSD